MVRQVGEVVDDPGGEPAHFARRRGHPIDPDNRVLYTLDGTTGNKIREAGDGVLQLGRRRGLS